MRFDAAAFARGVSDVFTLRPLRRWLSDTRSECDEIVLVAMLVRELDRRCPDWNEVQIIRRRERPEGGIDMRVLK